VGRVRIVIAGGHGQIALLLARRLAEAGHEPLGLIRSASQQDDLLAAGATPVLIDLEQSTADDVAEILRNVDAAVFAAGAGPGSTAERKLTVDRDGAILLADACEIAGVRRLVVVSAMAADAFDLDAGDVFQVYLRAKSEADASVRSRDLDLTIVRPGGLTNEAATGLVTVGDRVGRGTIPRDDVAGVLEHVLTTGAAVRRQFEVVSGSTPIPVAVG
jgi:nucleoside-diphosphate-sugar epimerase